MPTAAEPYLLRDSRIANRHRDMTLGGWIAVVPTVVPCIGSWKGQQEMGAVTLTHSSQCAVTVEIQLPAMAPPTR